MKNQINILLLLSMILSGCASEQSMPGNDTKPYDAEGILPIDQQQGPRESTDGDNIGFEDISLSAQKRLQVLTNKMEIDKETENYINSGQADVITRPDGTILYPYGLVEANLTVKKMFYSKIILQEGERIISAAAGDTIRWNILLNYIGDANSYTPVVLIKPFMGGLQTSLSIITDRRDYDISIQSVSSGDYMPRIGFYYPQEKADMIDVGLPPGKIDHSEGKQPKVDIENIKYDYRIWGDRMITWYPMSVFEDGNKVFIRMPDKVDRSQLPVFMMVDRKGRPEVVNYRYFNPYFVIDTIFDRGILMLGTDKYKQIIRLARI